MVDLKSSCLSAFIVEAKVAEALTTAGGEQQLSGVVATVSMVDHIVIMAAVPCSTNGAG